MTLRAWLFVAAVGIGGCSAHVPTPSSALQSGDGFVTVPYPPPVGRVEFVPPQPDPRAVWVDGSWEWQGREWTFAPGRWEVPPARGARYARPTCVRSPSGPLFFYPGRWVGDDGMPIPNTPPKEPR